MLSLLRLRGGGDGLKNQTDKSDFRESVKRDWRRSEISLVRERGYSGGSNGASGRIRTSDRSVRSRVLYPAELRMHRGYCFTAVHVIIADTVEKHGASGRIRTSDRSVRSRVLYPAELRMHRGYCFTAVHVIIADTVEKYGASGRIIRLRLTLTGRC